METLFLSLEKLFIEGIFLTIPDSFFVFSFAFLLSGFKEKYLVKKILLCSIFIAFIDISFRLFFEGSGLNPFVLTLFVIVFLRCIFKIDFISAIASSLISLMLVFILQMLYFGSLVYFLKIDTSIFASSSNLLLKITFSYIYFAISSMLLFIIYKKNLMIINLNKNHLFAKIKNTYVSEYLDNVKIVLIFLIPTIVLLILNFSIHYHAAFNNIEVSSIPYLAINSFALIVSNILIIFLIKKIIKLKHYKLDWKVQQHYLNDVNELLKRMREQKHGFINHMNIILGLINLDEYDDAKKYLLNIHQIISTTNNVISVDNPTLSALLNVKAKIAENKNIKFDVNVDMDIDLSQIKFMAFEICEAIGNIIDNAFEATYELKKENRYVKINISCNSELYVFDIQNTGKTIPPHIIDRLFEEGFTTKVHENQDHGFGLYISKKIIEYHNGKIEAESKNSKTSFKIYIPKVIKNEFKAS